MNVGPNREPGSYTVRIQRRSKGSWVTLKASYRTKGTAEIVKANLPKGTYRATVLGKYGYAAATSNIVKLAK